MQMIESSQNPRVKQWAELLTKKGREKQDKFLIEGVHLVQEALKAGVDIESILYSAVRGWPAEIEPHRAEGLERIPVSEAVLKKCADTLTPQSICAVVRRRPGRVEDILARKPALAVVVDGLQDPGNLGTIIRTADAVQAAGVLIGAASVDVYNPKTIRSTMGSFFHVPVAVCDLKQVLPSARQRAIRLVYTDLRADRHCYEADFTEDVWFVIGSEAHGVSDDIAGFADQRVRIPMHGQAESLNAAMAASVLLYEAFRQRHYAR